jgi:uncharacterized protein (DUF885 family)
VDITSKRLRPVVALLVLWTSTLVVGQAQQRSIAKFFDDFTDEWIRLSPNQATNLRYFSGPQQDALESQLTPNTREWRQRRLSLAKRGISQLRTFDRTRLSDSERTSAELMEWLLSMQVEGDKFDDYAFPIDQFQGATFTLVNTITVNHPVNNEKDAQHYVARLRQVATRLDEATRESTGLAAKGMMPPRFILAATIAQMENFVRTPAAGNPFVSALNERMIAASLPADRREALRAQAEQITVSQIYPAWTRAITALRPMQARASEAAGLSRLKGGREAYAHFLRRTTSTNYTPDEIHAIGLREVARIEGEMDAVLRRLGRTEGTVNARIEQLKKDQAYPLTAEGRTQIMRDIEAMMADAAVRAKPLFDKTPRAAVIARPFPEFREASAAASYNAPARDGSRPGTFQIPLRPSRMTKFGLRTLVHHETVPGHHFQVALELENPDTPRFRQVRALGGIPAFGEGWGLYAEQLAAENGWYDGDLEGLLGQLDAALFRARRLVVDTGLHAKGWTRQQAIDYGIEASEVERYVVNPGQACAYMLGQLKLVELRDRTRTALGAKFDAKAFHNLILTNGTLPLTLVERVVDGYIAAQTAPQRTVATRSGTSSSSSK